MTIKRLAKSVFRRTQYNASRANLERFLFEASQSVLPGSLVLDAGAGETPYRDIFKKMHYEAVDFCKSDFIGYGHIDYVCDLVAIPVKSDRYDLVICTQVLEHVPEPTKALTEVFRVLKPGGKLWLTAPLFFAEHMEPFDYYRYTQFGLRHLLNNVGFRIDKLFRLEGYYVTLAYQLTTAAKSLPIAPSRYGGGAGGFIISLLALPLKLQFLVLGIIFSHLEKAAKIDDVAYSKNYAVIAMKP